MLGAIPQTRLATPNTANPTRYDDRGPIRNSIGLTMAAAITDPNPVTADSQHLRDRLQDGLQGLLARTAAADAMHPALTVADVMLLLCGIGFAIRHPPDRDDPGLPDRYLNALLDGVLTRHIA